MAVKVVGGHEGRGWRGHERLDAFQINPLLCCGQGHALLPLASADSIFQLGPEGIADMIPKPEEWAEIGRSRAAEEGGGDRPVLILVPLALDEAQGDQGIRQDADPGTGDPCQCCQSVERSWSVGERREQPDLVCDKHMFGRHEARSQLEDRLWSNIGHVTSPSSGSCFVGGRTMD
jgi:hypothetical protein